MITPTTDTMAGQGSKAPESGAGTGTDTVSIPIIQQDRPQQAKSPILAAVASPSSITQSQNMDVSRNAMERSSAVSLRAAFRSNLPDGSHHDGGTIRAVTPDMGDISDSGLVTSEHGYMPRGLASHDTSPRSIPGGQNRRQGMVFNDSFGESYEGADASSPPLSGSRLPSSTIRPRTRTMDMAMLATQRANAPVTPQEQRHRVGSVSSSGSQAVMEEQRQPAAGLESTGFPTIMGGRIPEPSSVSSKSDKKIPIPSRRLIKRQSSRPTSPPTPLPPFVDALPFPLYTDNPRKVLLLMNTLCGKMRGNVEYQGESGGPWHAGMAYIDEDRGCLMFDSGQNGPFHIPLVADLRGCRILPVDYPQAGKRCLELVSSSPIIEVLLHPLVSEEFDLWLAALLGWQQMRASAVKLSTGAKPTSPVSPVRPELRRRGISTDNSKPSSIIKVGNVQVWDKGPPSSPRAVVKRFSTRDPRSPLMAWRRVSCILQDNGEFKLMSENNVTILSTVDLSQLSRCAIQQLDHTVLDEEYCIAIFPMYSDVAERLSIFRPVYLALDDRTHFEVWFALLRAFTVPDVYKLDDPEKGQVLDVNDLALAHKGPVFRVVKTILVRVTEAKLKAKSPSTEAERAPAHHGHHGPRQPEVDPLTGNYLAEVILDGEVRARTTIKMATKNPFWRDDCEFIDLPPSLPKLSVVLKRVDGIPDAPSHLSPVSTFRPSATAETIFGTVDLSLRPSDAGSKDNELWHQIQDDKQESIGSMLIRVAYDEHVVLLAKEYEPLSQLLHNFPTGLTTLIAAALPGQLRRLAELFINIFQVSGKAGDWLMTMIEDEIDGVGNQANIKKYRFGGRLKSNESIESSTTDRELIVRDMSKSLAGEANLLFRGNTLLTQALEFHMRRLGKEFLEETLLDKLSEINDLNPDCEVDPSKLASHSNMELEQHWNRLLDITTEVWQCIAASAKKIHPELRHILKYVRAVAEDRYYDFLRSVAYTSVSGFLFLRFICPAILSPKLFGLLRDHPRPRAQRTFTLIAKALQKMANLSTFGKREEWMEPMNRFLNTQRTVFKDYIDHVCDIPAERGPQNLPPSYSTPVTILNRLGPTAREGFPSLPFLIDQSRNYASLVKLWVDMKPTDPSKKALIEGDLQVFSDLCIALQQCADSCLAKHETLRLAAEAEGQATAPDELADILEQASLIESTAHSYPGSAVWTESDQRPGSSGSDTVEDNGRRSRDMRRGRDTLDVKKASGSRHVSSSGTTKDKKPNGKMGRTILNGIMRMGGRAESPDSKEKR